MIPKIIFTFSIFTMLSLFCFSQNDTVTIDASKVNTHYLIPGTHRYLVYFKMGKDSSRKNYQLWSRTIEFSGYNGNEAIIISQEWENNDTIVHKTNSILNKKNFSTIRHSAWWRGSGTLNCDFTNKEVSFNDKPLQEMTDSNSIKKYRAFQLASSQYFLNWHLDLEVFSILPYRDGVAFRINFYDPGFSPPRYETYAVAGSATLTGYNNQKIDCWLLQHGSLPGNLETFWISKQTREVLKLEQEFNGHFRYKIKLGYSENS